MNLKKSFIMVAVSILAMIGTQVQAQDTAADRNTVTVPTGDQDFCPQRRSHRLAECFRREKLFSYRHSGCRGRCGRGADS